MALYDYGIVLTAHIRGGGERISINSCFHYLTSARKNGLSFSCCLLWSFDQNSNCAMRQVKLCRCLAVYFAANSPWQARQEMMLFTIRCSTGTLLDFVYGWVAKLMIPARKNFRVKLMYTRPYPGTVSSKMSPTQFCGFVCFFGDLTQVLEWRQRCFLKKNSGFGSGILQPTFPSARGFVAGFLTCWTECQSCYLLARYTRFMYLPPVSNIKS